MTTNEKFAAIQALDKTTRLNIGIGGKWFVENSLSECGDGFERGGLGFPHRNAPGEAIEAFWDDVERISKEGKQLKRWDNPGYSRWIWNGYMWVNYEFA